MRSLSIYHVQRKALLILNLLVYMSLFLLRLEGKSMAGVDEVPSADISVLEAYLRLPLTSYIFHYLDHERVMELAQLILVFWTPLFFQH